MSAAADTWPRTTCAQCGQAKVKHAFAPTGDIGEDLTVCRACRGEAKRAASRERIAAQADKHMTELTRGSVGPRVVPLAPTTPPPAAQQSQTAPVPQQPFPLVRMILRYLPLSGQWTEREQTRFLDAFIAALNLEIRIVDGE